MRIISAIFFFLDVVLLGYKVLGICNFAVKIMNITFRVFTAKISVIVFSTNFKCTIAFTTCSLRLVLLVNLKGFYLFFFFPFFAWTNALYGTAVL